jgi:sterol 3beta-glucosyltransferase
MRVVIIATGSRGDVQPYLALGKGLLEAGHNVRLVTHNNFEGLVCSHGVEFWPVESDVQAIAQSEAMRERIEEGNFLHLMALMAREAQRGAAALAEVGLAACRGADLILAGMGGLYTGLALAEKLDLSFVPAYLVPFTPTRSFPSVLTPNLPDWSSKWLNRISHQLTRQAIWQGFRRADQLARRDILGLPPAPLTGPYSKERRQGYPILYGFSPSVIPIPSDWGDEVRVTGYWFLDGGQDWAPSPELVDFLEAGPPPIYIGFGSMSSRDPKETAQLAIQALKLAKQRGVLLSGWGGLEEADLPGEVMMVESIPHTWLFTRMAAVVHHGGAGTTGAGLRAGVPSVIVPFFGDQPFWGRRVADLGVGPRPIPRKKLTTERLAHAIRQSVSDQGMRRRAAELGTRIRAEDGVSSAVKVIEAAV